MDLIDKREVVCGLDMWETQWEVLIENKSGAFGSFAKLLYSVSFLSLLDHFRKLQFEEFV